MNNLFLPGLVPMVLALLLSVPIIVVADMEHTPQGEARMEENADAEPAPKEELEALKEKHTALLVELTAVRRDIFHLRRRIEAEDEQARELVREMNELRRALREKNAELEELIGSRKEFIEAAEREANLLRSIHSLAGIMNDVQVLDSKGKNEF